MPAGLFASKPAPTLEYVPLWERACSRRRSPKHHTSQGNRTRSPFNATRVTNTPARHS